MKAKINAKGTEITVLSKGNEDDYISLTDIAKYKNKDDAFIVINNWMRLRSTIEFLGLWEQLSNRDFKPIEFDRFKYEAGSNAFTLSPQNKRLLFLNKMAIEQMKSILDNKTVNQLPPYLKGTENER